MSSQNSVFFGMRKSLLMGAALFMLAALMMSAGGNRDALASSETRFVEHSANGMQIVPASCPSSPHYAGECSSATSQSASGCSIVANPASISSGQSSNLSWSVANQVVLFVTSSPSNITLTSLGSVAPSGSIGVSPTQTTDYVLSGIYTVAGIQTGNFSCHAVVTVNGPQCPVGQSYVNGDCVTMCPTGQHAVGNICICDVTNVAPDSSGQCTRQACPTGFQWDAGSGQCVQVNQCTEAPTCADYTHVLMCDGTAIDCVAQNGAGWYCSGGSCHRPQPPIASINAVPSLVHQGNTTNVAWTSQYTSSCTVSGNNGDGGAGWSGTTGSHISSALVSQTIYTLSCLGLDGSTISRTVSVNIIPIESEQ